MTIVQPHGTTKQKYLQQPLIRFLVWACVQTPVMFTCTLVVALSIWFTQLTMPWSYAAKNLFTYKSKLLYDSVTISLLLILLCALLLSMTLGKKRPSKIGFFDITILVILLLLTAFPTIAIWKLVADAINSTGKSPFGTESTTNPINWIAEHNLASFMASAVFLSPAYLIVWIRRSRPRAIHNTLLLSAFLLSGYIATGTIRLSTSALAHNPFLIIEYGYSLILYSIALLSVMTGTLWVSAAIFQRQLVELKGRCQTCNYDLTGLTSRCPECGSEITPQTS